MGGEDLDAGFAAQLHRAVAVCAKLDDGFCLPTMRASVTDHTTYYNYNALKTNAIFAILPFIVSIAAFLMMAGEWLFCICE